MGTDERVGLADELLLLAVSNPDAAEARAVELLSGTPDPWLQSVARHARGLAQRERGDFARPSPSCAAPSVWPPAAATPTGRPTSGPRSASRWPWPAGTAQGLTQLDRAVAEAPWTRRWLPGS